MSRSMDPPPTLATEPAPVPHAGWAARLARFKRPLVAVAGIGAVLSGLAGWWNALSTVRNAATATTATVVSTTANGPTAAARPTPLSVVVMPFTNLTGDPQKAYVADGLTANLTADLAHIRDAYVVPATTAFTYRDKNLTAPQLGQALGVGYVVTGSLLNSGTKLRVTAQLVDARSDAQVWTRHFDGDVAELAGLQDQITSEIATGTGNVMITNVARESAKRKGNATVIDLRLRARALNLQPQSESTLLQQQALLRQALALDPTDPVTQVQLAQTLHVFAFNNERGTNKSERRKKHMAEARQLAAQASAAQPDDVAACRLMGDLALEDGSIDVARRMLERCVTLDAGANGTLNDLAMAYIYDGPEGARKAVELLQQAAATEGTHPSEATQLNLGEALFAAGDSAHAVEPLQMALRINPNFTEAWLYLAMAYADIGDTVRLHEAKAAMDAYRATLPDRRGYDFKDFEQSNSIDTPGYRVLRDTRFLPLWRKAGFEP